MPLLDHFHPPIYPGRAWESFHTMWLAEIMAALNQGELPSGYFAEAQVNFGGRVEVDVATLTRSDLLARPSARKTTAALPFKRLRRLLLKRTR